MKLTLTEAQAQLLTGLKISKFASARFKPFAAGERISCSPSSTIEALTRHAPDRLIHMGAFSYVVEKNLEMGSLQMGRYCSVAIGLRLLDGRHPLEAVTTNPYSYAPHYKADNIPSDYVYRGMRRPAKRTYGPVKMGHDVWIGAHCTIKAGVSIGHGAVIAGGANVVKDVAPYAIVGGNPAKLIRFRFAPELCARLLALAWWNVSPRILRDMNLNDPEDFCTRLEQMQAQGPLLPFTPAKLHVTAAGQIEVIDEGST